MTRLRMEEAVRLQQAMTYCPDTGQFFWRTDRPEHHFTRSNEYVRYRNTTAGQEVKSCKNSNGYLHIRFGYKIIPLHQVAFVLMMGRFPEHHMDHIDGNKANNIWNNLREVPRIINNRNRRRPSNNTSGVTGVCWHKTKKKWIAKGVVDGKEKQLGAFIELEDAIKAREAYFANNPHLGYTHDHGKR